MPNNTYLRAAAIYAICASTPSLAQPYGSDEAGQDAGLTGSMPGETSQGIREDEIVVTARKRGEASIAAPVVVTVISSEQIARQNLSSIDEVSRLVPQLLTGQAGAGLRGGVVSIRGIGSGDSNVFLDDGVAFNIDGVAIASASVRRLSGFDMEQIEVLKGPQALYYGKNSPGGVVIIRTADPGKEFSAGLSGGYEFKAREKRVNGFVSTPLTDNVGARIAFFGTDMDGWAKNLVPDGELLEPSRRRIPHFREYGIRGTLKLDGDQFDVRAKTSFNRSRQKGSGPAGNSQLVNCPLGHPQGTGTTGPLINDCKPNATQYKGDVPRSFVAASGGRYFGDDAVPFLNQNQLLSSLEINYRPSDLITVSSVTGLYDIKFTDVENFSNDYDPRAISADHLVKKTYFSQEFRLQTDPTRTLYAMVGGLYGHTKFRYDAYTLRNARAPVFHSNISMRMVSESWSAFGLLGWNVTPEIELSGGARYSEDKRRLTDIREASSITGPLVQVTPKPSEDKWTNWSPEATLAWRPSKRLTLFASYKTGFLSGGFNGGATTLANADLRYDPQKIEGFEGGVKAAILDGAMRVNAAYFNYKMKGLAINAFVNNIPVIISAGKLKIEGVEADASLDVPGVPNLSLNGTITYNHARYVNYVAPCWTGQSIAQGCDVAPGASGAFTLQDLSGTPLYRAPEWAGTVGLNYETEIGGDLKLGFGANGVFSGGFFSDGRSMPGARQKSYAQYDAFLTVGRRDDSWSVGLVGRNLTNKYVFFSGGPNPFTGTGTGTAKATPADAFGTIGRGREIWLRLSLGFGG